LTPPPACAGQDGRARGRRASRARACVQGYQVALIRGSHVAWLLVAAATDCRSSVHLSNPTNWMMVSLPDSDPASLKASLKASKRYGLHGAQWSYPALASSPAAAIKTAGKSVSRGEAIIMVPNLVSAAECEALESAGRTVVNEQYPSSSAPGLVRLPLKTARNQRRAADAAARAGKACQPSLTSTEDHRLAATILLRVLQFVDTELATLVRSEFHAPPILPQEAPRPGLVELYGARELEYAPREPAVNIYAPGGTFAPHKDYQALTVLVTLSSPDCFRGGGTGFWSRADSADDLTPTPSLVMRPPRGSVLLFGGGLMHSGLELETGSRAVFVASFSNKLYKPAGGFGQLFE